VRKITYFINFSGYDRPDQRDSDYEYWSPHDAIGGKCILGRVVNIVRRKSNSICFHPVEFEKTEIVKNCTCIWKDYECDYCYTKDFRNTSLCVKDRKSDHCEDYEFNKPPEMCAGNWTKSRGYRKVPGDSCIIPIPQLEPFSASCEADLFGESNDSAPFMIILILIAIMLTIIGLWFLSGKSQTWRKMVNVLIPDQYLPDIKETIPNVDYTQLVSNFSSEEEGDDQDAKIIKIQDSSNDDPSSEDF